MKKFQRGFTLIELVMTLLILASLTITGGIFYILFHFIQKFW
jgi:prepilin-type N-terminal cleavage/methylation domain-containing protein